MNIVKDFVSVLKYNKKCPYKMTPTRIVVHNTYNDASAKNEISYMKSNNNAVSFHYAVDDVEIRQGIPENRNSWNAGDGTNGKGNREGIAIEICYSKSGGDRFIKAEQNAVDLIVDILKRYNWGIDKVTKHQDYSGKYCPHRTLDMGWKRFIGMIEDKLNVKPTKSIDELAKEVMQGKWGNGADRKKRLTDAGYDYSKVQAKVNELVSGKTTTPTQKKSVDAIAREVIQGKWGNGQDRKNRLTKAGYNYAEVQKKVNQLLK
jgi:N-acetylmuramoyl-L-alanine amidase CwlA